MKFRLHFEKISNSIFVIVKWNSARCVDALKVLKTAYDKGSFSRDCILMIDGMYLQKSAQHQSREYIWVNEKENLDKRIFTFVVVGSKQSIHFVVQAIPEVIFNGQWLAEKINNNIENLIEIELLCMRYSYRQWFS